MCAKKHEGFYHGKSLKGIPLRLNPAFRRTLCVLLCLCMLVGMMPSAALAAALETDVPPSYTDGGDVSEPEDVPADAPDDMTDQTQDGDLPSDDADDPAQDSDPALDNGPDQTQNDDPDLSEDTPSTPETVLETVETPVITADENHQVTIACATGDAVIYYTTDGTEPNFFSAVYTAPFTLTEALTVKAIAAKDGMAVSMTAEREIMVIPPVSNELVPRAAEHITPLANTALSGFGDGSDWTNGDPARFSIVDGSLVAAANPTAASIIQYKYNDNINAGNFLIQYDLALHQANPNTQTRVRFKMNNSGDYVQVRFHTTGGGEGNEHTEGIYIGVFDSSSTENEAKQGEFKLRTDEAAKIDIEVKDNTITVYKDGTQVATYTNAAISGMDVGAVAFASNWQQNYTISNLLITTDEDLDAPPANVFKPAITANGAEVTITCETAGATIYYTTDGSEPTASSTQYSGPFTLPATATVKAIAVKAGLTDSAVAEKQVVVANTDVVHYLTPYDRVLLPKSALDNADSWDLSNANVSISNGEATISGSGPLNRMGYKIGRINANNFLIQLDLTPNAGNTNCDAKIAFKCTGQYEDDRLQLRLDFPKGDIYLERTSNNSSTDNLNPDWAVSAKYSFTPGMTYGIDIEVKDDTINVYINGGPAPAITATRDDIASMGKGYFAIAGQFPNQDFTIKNLSITTNEQQTGEQYTVTLKTATDGVVDAVPAGGTVTADTLTGYAGDLITLTTVPAHGYVLEKFTSFKADGSSTDGLMPITNNTFTLDSKFGNVTVIAHFVKRVPGKFELFYDDFAAAGLDASYTVKNPDKISQDGVITIDAAAGDNNYVILKPDIFAPVKDGEGVRISVDAWKADSTTGTMQIIFKGVFDDRYVLVINGSMAVFRHIHSGGNDKLTDAAFTFSSSAVDLVLEVQDSTAVFSANGKEILRYTSPDNWGGAANAAGLINMTPNAPVCFDDLLVERIPTQLNVEVAGYILSNGTETPDSLNTAGTASASASKVVEGDEVTMTAVAKPGYRLKSYAVTDGNETEIPVTNGVFTVPDGAAGPISVKAVFEAAAPRAARSFFIDSEGGSDSGDGTIGNPWKTLDKLAAYTQTDPLVPGDQVLLKRGSVFNSQQLRFSGMGSQAAPVLVSAYGEGPALPRLNGQGDLENVVSLYNQQYITLSNLEITNTDPAYNSAFTLNSSNNTAKPLRAINVSAKDFGVVSGIHILDCYIHDINGNISLKWNGGIFFDVQADVDPVSFTLTGVPTKYDDVLIEGCTFINVDRSGIKLVNSAWCNQWLPNNKALPINWYPSTNVIIRNNYMDRIGGDGITTRDTDGTLIEYNLVKDCRYQNTGYNVGIWPFQAANTVIQYNEAYNTHSTTDGQGLDCDHASSYSLMQYNYSHNNEGGFMLIMGGYPHTAATVRYNISQNDYDKTFEFAQGIPMGTMIYNNTIYSQNGVSRGVLFLSNTANGRGINDLYLFNNLFIYPAGQAFYGSMANELKAHAKLYNNGYVGLTAPAEEANAISAANIADVLMNAGSAPESNTTRVPVTGSSGALDGYKLAEGSPMTDQGVTIAEAVEYFGGSGFQVFDGRSMSPNGLESLYYGKGETSLKYAMGENFPRVAGVDYELDFFGEPNLQNNKPDIGAAETLDHVHTGGAATCAAGAVCDICGKHYGAPDPNNHTGSTEIRGAYEATATQPGYSGDTYCADCGALLAAGHVIPATGTTDPDGPGPVDPKPDGPGPVDPKPDGPGPVDPKPDGPGPVDPKPIVPSPSVPSPGSGGSTAPSLPVSTGSAEQTVTTTAAPAATVSGGTASVVITASMSDEIVRQAETNNSESVVIAPMVSGSVSTTAVSIPASTFDALSSRTSADLTVKTPAADVTVRNGDLGQLGGKTGTVTITVSRPENDFVEIVVAKDGQRLDRVGSGLKAEIPVPGAASGTVAILVEPDGTERILRKAVADNGAFDLLLEGSAAVRFKDNARSFTDTQDHWASSAIDFVSSRELFLGVSEDRFAANDTMDRAMLVTVLHRLENTPRGGQASFQDVAQDKWYAEAVAWASDAGIVVGNGAGFDPNGSISREQLVTFLYRYARYTGADVRTSGGLSSFADAANVSGWAEAAIVWAVENELLFGRGSGLIAPKETATRGETAEILLRFCQKIASTL